MLIFRLGFTTTPDDVLYPSLEYCFTQVNIYHPNYALLFTNIYKTPCPMKYALIQVSSDQFHILEVDFDLFLGKKNMSSLQPPLEFFNEKSSNQFYICISVVRIPQIYSFALLILLLINMYSMWCALSYFIFILTENITMILIHLFINFHH